MFEDTLLESSSGRSPALTRRRRIISVVVATILEFAAIGALILVPLIRTQALDLKNLKERVVPPPAPRSVKIIAVLHERGGGATPQPTHGTRMIAPREIPNQIPVLTDPPIGPANSKGPIDGVPTLNSCLACVIGSTNYEVSVFRPPTPPPPLEPKPVQRIARGGEVQAAKLIDAPKPEYPPMAKIVHVQGMVRIEAILGADGRIQNLRVTSGHPMLVKAALDAVSQWRYQPTLLNGEAVEVETEIVVNFIPGE